MNNGFYEFSRGKQESTSPVFPYTGSATISGSLIVTGSISATQGFTGSLFGTAFFAISSSFAQTASFALNSISSSFAVSSSRAVSSSFAISASWAPTQTIDTGSLVTTSSFNSFTSSYNTGSFTGSFNGVFTGSLFGTASRAISASYAVSGGNQNFQQVTANGNVTTTSVIINNDNILTTKSFKVNNTTIGGYAELTSDVLVTVSPSGTTSGFANGALTLGDLNQDITNPVNLSVINDTTNYGVGFLLNSSAVVQDVSLFYHPNYFVSQSTYNAPVNFYIPYKPEGTVVSLATLDDIPNTSSLATTGSNTFIGNQVITGSLNITGSITATTYNNLPTSSGSSSGILSSTDWTTFNNKQNNLKTFNRTQGIYYFEDFMGQLNSNIGTSVNSIHNAVSNGQGTTRSTTSITNRTNQQGVVESLTSANATGTAGFGYGSGHYKGSGSITMETYFNITTLSTLAERFFTIFGWITGANLTNPLNAILITYDEGGVVTPNAGGTPNFRCITRGGSTVTNTISSVPVVAGQWYKLKINISSDGGTVTFFIDDALVATHSTNLPLNTTAILPYSIIAKSSGTAARAMQTDYFMYEEIFTNPR
jgi:hypothetical protein